MSPSEKQLSVAHVIDMFKGLNLPVTDDGQQIEVKGKELNDFYLRKKNSPDPQERHEATIWFKNLTALKTRRAALLDVVREHFIQQADLNLETVLSSGTTTLTPKVYAGLEGLALKQCKCDPPLARAFAEDYLRKSGLKIGEPLVYPQLVKNLVAVPSVEQVELKWKLPEKDCDEVIVRRFKITQAGKTMKTGQELCRGKRTNYVDRDVRAGQRYHYKVYSIWRGVESRSKVSAETTAIGEISDVQARWERDHVKLSWRKPASDCQVFVFRAPSPIALVQRGTSEPRPDNPEAERIFRGPESEWHDQEVAEGEEYYYLLVAFFAPGYFSNGVSISTRTPIPPPAVRSIRAEYLDGVVKVSWEPVRSLRQVEYVVVRTPGATPASSPEEGKRIAATKRRYCRDKSPENGKQYTYTVFACRDGVYSRRGCSTDPVATVADVREVTIEEGDGSVTLKWEKPPEAHQVIVRRSLERITRPGEGILVPLAGPGLAQDAGLHNDREYHYLLYCSYLLEGGEQAFSPGIQRTAIPRQLPGELSSFQVAREGNQIVCTWDLDGPGAVVIVRTRKPPPYEVGAMLTDRELSELGHRLSTAGTNQVIDTRPTPAEPYYGAFVVAGSHVRAGPWRQCIASDDVSNLRLAAEAEGVRLRWYWPEQCKAVAIVRRQDDWPTGVDDPLATRFDCSRAEYENNFNSFLDRTAGTSKVFYIVYAQPYDAPERVFSPGLSSGCRGSVQPGSFGRLRYSLKIERQRRFFGPRGLLLEWKFDVRPGSFSGFRLVGNSRTVPSEPTEGAELFRWTPAEPETLPIGPQKEWIALDDSQLRNLGHRFYCRLFHLNPDEREQVLIVHPDLNRPLEIQ